MIDFLSSTHLTVFLAECFLSFLPGLTYELAMKNVSGVTASSFLWDVDQRLRANLESWLYQNAQRYLFLDLRFLLLNETFNFKHFSSCVEQHTTFLSLIVLPV